MTRLRHYDDLDTARFVTFSWFMRRPYLLEERTGGHQGSLRIFDASGLHVGTLGVAERPR